MGVNPNSRTVAMIVALSLLLTGCQEQIVHDLSEREANAVISQLSMAHLDARKVQQADGRWAISVDQDEMIQALSYIENRRVLTTRDPKVLSSKGGMIPSREEQWFRYERSVAASLEESLSVLPGVLDARVHVNLPDDDPLFGDSARKGGSGSVLLVVDRRYATGHDEVAALVSGAAGLSRDVVRVLTSEAVQTNVVEGDSAPAAIVAGVPPSVEPEISWLIPSWVASVSAFAFGVVVCGGRFLTRRRKRRVAFELPKELDFEG